MSQAGANSSSGGGGGGIIQTINGDTGSITGATVTIYADNAAANCGSTVKFVNSGTISTLNVSDATSTIIGAGSGMIGSTAHYNTMLGVGCGSVNASGNGGNTLFGYMAGAAITTGDNNQAFGQSALGMCDVGVANWAFGGLTFITSGSYNVSFGGASGLSYTSSESSNIVLDNDGVIGDNNTIRIGRQGNGPNQQNLCYVAGIAGVTPPSPNMVIIDPTTGQLGEQAIPSSLTYYSVTPYIVGPTGDTHAQFTGDTGIQAAINQAVSDGHNSGNPANIYIKPGNYSPTGFLLTLYDGIFLYAFDSQNTLTSQGVTIFSEYIFNGDGIYKFTGINLSEDGMMVNPTFLDTTAATSNAFIEFNNCSIKSANTVFVSSSAGCVVTIKMSTCYGIYKQVIEGSTSLGNVQLSAKNSVLKTFNNSSISATGANFYLLDCYATEFLGSPYIATGDGQLIMNVCYYCLLPTFDSTGSTLPTIIQDVRYCDFTDVTLFGSTFAATQEYCMNAVAGQQTIYQRKYDSYSADIALNVFNNFVGIDPTSAPIAVTLPNASTYFKGYTITIKDITGMAGTNAITIADPFGALIDGQASLVIGANYGSATLTYDTSAGQWYIN